MQNKRIFALSVLTLALNQAVYAADDVAQTSGIQTLPEVKVTATQEKYYSATTATAATKTEKAILETPMAVQVVPSEVIEDRQITSIQEAVKNVSGVQSPTSLFYDSYLLRGFSTGANTFVNGLKTYGITGTEDMAFVERVEIAKGPTAMLYGRIQPGGLVNIVTKKPQANSAFSVQQQIGSYNTYRTTADATGAVNEDKTVLYRVIGTYDKGDSFIDYQHHDNKAVAGYFAWVPSARFESNLQLEYFDMKDSNRGTYGQQIPIIGNRPANVPRNWTQNDPVMWSTFPETVKRTVVGYDWTYKFDEDWKLTNRFFHNSQDELQTYLLASGYNATTNLYSRKIVSNPYKRGTTSSNLDLTGKFGTGYIKHEVLVGLDGFYHWEDTTGFNPTYTGTGSIPLSALPQLNVFAPVYGNINASAVQALINASGSNVLWRSKYRDIGVYAQDQVSLGERWELLLGGRYDIARDVSSSVYGTTNAACYPNCTGSLSPSYHSETQFSPRAGLLYKVSNDVSVYGSYSKSFGYSTTSISYSGERLPPQQGVQYEFGAKANLLDGKVTTSATLYDLRLINVLTPDLAHTGYSLAVGETRSQGLEFDVAGQVTSHISLIGSYTYDRAVITRDNTVGAANTQGKTWAGVPLNSASVWAKYDTVPGASDSWSYGVGAYLNGQRQMNNTNTAQLPGYGRLDAMVGYRTKYSGKQINLQLNVQNLLDKIYFENGGGTAQYGTPRSIMGSVKVDL